MPIMAHHEQSSNYSSPNSGFIYNNNNNNSGGYGSPESPTINHNRKRKQEQEFHFNDIPHNNGVLNTMYSSYQSSWSHPSQDFIVPMSSSSSSTTYQQQHHQEDIIQKSSLINTTTSWQPTCSNNDAFFENNYDNSFISTQKTVGENNTEIHQILNLDQFTKNNNTRNTSALQLNDTRLMHQPWSPQQQTSFQTGANSPGFFTPGFLESLQEDESESSSSFPFHVPTKNWNIEQNKPMEHDHAINPSSSSATERTFVSQETMPLSLFHSGPSSPIPSSSSSSSPPTYIHKFTTPPPIIEEPSTMMMDHRRSLQVDVMNARLLQNAMNTAKMKPLIQQYLSGHGEEKTVVILTSKVAQKSYGTEKRFLCPPPTAILVGTSWWTKNQGGVIIENTNEILKRGQEEFNPPKLTVSISGETTTQSGHIEWYTVSGVTVGQTGHVKPQQQPAPSNTHSSAEHPSRFRSSSESRSNSIDWYQNHHQELLSAGKCVSKHLYINDADEKRKRVECIIKIQLANGLSLGSLASKGIKVISKPSKKRQSVKNMELCIHHGTTVSLFNRIRSQTVSTKYLGVSTAGSPFTFPGQTGAESAPVGEGTCFVARTTCWDPFVIWIVDTTRTPGDAKDTDTPEDFIGKSSAFVRNIKYPPPPAIALKNKSAQLIPIHYNQHVVLQCLTTGLVSPVMIIRKVDKASTVVGGAKCLDDLNLLGGGEYGDEVLGDPVSQLHKVALQIVQDPTNANHRQQQQPSRDYYRAPPSTPGMPRTSHPVTYLACLNDMVGMHKTTDPRKLIHPPPPAPIPSTSNSTMDWDVLDMFDVTSQDEKVIRKRRVSVTAPVVSDHSMMMMQQQRYNNDDYYSPTMPPPPSTKLDGSRKSSISSASSTGRRSSVSSSNNQTLGAYWNEDVSDAAVWTIVGTDCATYTFCSPSPSVEENVHPSSFPSLTSFTTKTKEDELLITLHGENFSRDIQVWFGDKKALQTDYRSRELLMCKVPLRNDLLETKATFGDIPILLVRGDGTICKTNKFYSL